MIAGDDKYFEVTITSTTSGAGLFPIADNIPVYAGEKYLIRAKGHRSGGVVAYIDAKVNTTPIDAMYTGLANKDGSEFWSEQVITIPSNGVLKAGVTFPSVTSGEKFYLNEFEVYKINNTAAEYQYHLKDHLGNVRMTFTTRDEVDKATASLETDSASIDASEFLRYDMAKRVLSALFDHTRDADVDKNGYAVRLNGTMNEKIGLAKSLSVMPGDSIKATVYGKYVDPDNNNWQAALTTLMGYLSSPGTAPAGSIIDGSGYGSSGSTPLGIIMGTPEDDEGELPKAYLNYIFINRNYDLSSMKFAYDRISGGKENGSNVPHDVLSINELVTEAGYVYVFLSNDEVGSEVYWDDFRVEHVKGPVMASQDYYPFGLIYNFYQREKALSNKFKFQSQEHVEDLALNWESYRYRNDQPDIGRFFNIDPMASAFYYNSPYAFSENKVTTHREMEGLQAFFIHGTIADNSMWKKDVTAFIMRELQPYVNANQDVDTGFKWNDATGGAFRRNWLGNGEKRERSAAARMLAGYIIRNRKSGQGITLVTHSHGGNVAIQAARILFNKYNISVNIINFNTPAFNNADDPENPWDNFGIEDMLHFFTEGDMVAGPLAGENAYGGLVGSNVNQIQLKDPLKKNFWGTDQHAFDSINWREVLLRFNSMMEFKNSLGGGKTNKKDKVDADKEACKRSGGC